MNDAEKREMLHSEVGNRLDFSLKGVMGFDQEITYCVFCGKETLDGEPYCSETCYFEILDRIDGGTN